MKPAFALILAQEGLSLLHRSGDGWVGVGDVRFNDPTVETALAGLRQQAQDLEPEGFATKVILPESQILYCETDAPGHHAAEREAHIARALEGRTPYDVRDLAFDWCDAGGGKVRAAVVARITLQEAEDFAEAQGFNPVSIVAQPSPEQFDGEPFFGQTRVAGNYLVGSLERDSEPVRATTGTTKDGSPEDAKAAAPLTDMPLSEQSGDSDIEVPATTVTQPDIPEEDERAPVSAPPKSDEAPFIAIDDESDGLGEFASRRSGAATDAATGSLTELVARLHLAPAAPAPPATEPRLGPAIEGAAITAPVVPVPLTADEDASDALKSRTGAVRAVLSTLPDARHGTQAQLRARRAESGADLHVPAAFRDSVRVPAPAPRGIPKKPVAVAAGLIALLALGAALFLGGEETPPEPASESGALQAPVISPREVAIAAAEPVASRSAPSPSTDSSPTPAPPATLTLPAGQDDAPAPATPSATDAAVAEALGGIVVPSSAPAGPEAPVMPQAGDEAPPLDLAPPAAVWTLAPDTAAVPTPDGGASSVIARTGEASLAAPDPATRAPDDLVVTPADDSAPPLQPLPPPFGQQIVFGPDGLIVATSEGVVTPDGFALFAGSPPLVPAPRPGSTPRGTEPAASEAVAGTETGPTAAAPPLPAPVDPAHAARKPLGRTASVLATAEAARLATETPTASGSATSGPGAIPAPGTIAAPDPVAEPEPLPAPVDPAHSGRKPVARPAAVENRAETMRSQAEAIADAAAAAARAEAAASQLAVTSSRRPADRPSAIAKAVEAAVASAVADAVTASAPAAPVTVEEEIDEPEPPQTMPNIPTTVTVAKQATIKNAINLSDMNLIGVFGSSSNRRALVRMPTGRLVKVKIGDRLDGGKVAAIGDSELTYVKNGRNFTLKIQGRG